MRKFSKFLFAKHTICCAIMPTWERIRELATQLIVSTHSSHVAHECEFSCLRYFRRKPPLTTGEVPITTVVNLSEVFGKIPDTQRFVTRYLKAAHCDLFFEDAEIFVEGPAERILVPNFVEPRLPKVESMLPYDPGDRRQSRASTARTDRAAGLITLVITDLDAADLVSGAAVPPARGSQQVTRNTTLRTWVPEIEQLDELLNATEKQKIKKYDDYFSIRVAYQFPLQVNLGVNSPEVELVTEHIRETPSYTTICSYFGRQNWAAQLKGSRKRSTKTTPLRDWVKICSIFSRMRKKQSWLWNCLN